MSKLSQSELEKLLKFGRSVLEASRLVVLELWQSKDFKAEYKEDFSPVTEVDKKAELLIRQLISKQYPDHGIIGEEFGVTNGESEFQWTVDPIDGTQSLVNHIPTFCTLIGLKYQDYPVLGFVDHPALDICTYGGQGVGVHCNDQKLQPFTNSEITRNDIINIAPYDCFKIYKIEGVFKKLFEKFPFARMYYDNYAGTLLSQGNIAGAVDLGKVWDVLPVEALTLELGGKVSKIKTTEKHSATILGREKIVEAILECFA